MNKLQFKQLIREEIRKVLKHKQLKESIDNGDYADSGDDSGVYDMLGPIGKAQKSFDTEYGWVMSKLFEVPEMESFMNRYESFETPKDVKNFNEGAIEYFTTFITKLKAINNRL